MVLMQLTDARMQTGEGFAMRGQDQRVLRQGHEAVNGLEKQRQRIGLGFRVEDAHIGGNARQHHVAADQHMKRGAMQGHVLRRVTKA